MTLIAICPWRAGIEDDRYGKVEDNYRVPMGEYVFLLLH
jgi:hypothetical protein